MKKGGTIQMRGGTLHASVYAALPGTAREIAERLGVLLEPVENTLRSMKTLGLCHRSAIVGAPTVRKQPTSQYSRGPGVNVPYPRRGLTNSRPAPGVIAFASVISAIEVGKTVDQISEETGCSKGYVRAVLGLLKDAKLAHVSAWSGQAREWSYGPGVNAAKPPPIPRKVVNLAHWHRRRNRLVSDAIQTAFMPAKAGQDLRQHGI